MAVVAKVIGVEKLVKNLKKVEQRLQGFKARAGRGSSVIVGFSASYALFVHENLRAFHPVGQAKFLEMPARTLRGEMAAIVFTTMRKGRSLLEGLLLAGLRLQREAQRLAPVDTGHLRASAFTRVD